MWGPDAPLSALDHKQGIGIDHALLSSASLTPLTSIAEELHKGWGGQSQKQREEEKVEDREEQLQREKGNKRHRKGQTTEVTQDRETGQGGLSDSRNSPSLRWWWFWTTGMGQDLAWDHRVVRGRDRAPGHRDFPLTKEGEREEHRGVRISQREAAGPWRASASGTPHLVPASSGLGERRLWRVFGGRGRCPHSRHSGGPECTRKRW